MQLPDRRGEIREAGLVEVHERDRVVLQHLRKLRLRLDRHRHRQSPVARRRSGRRKRHRCALRLGPLACATALAGSTVPAALRRGITLRSRLVTSPSGFGRLFLSPRGRRSVLPLIYLIVLRMFSASHVKSPLHTSRVRSGEARSAFRPDRTHRHAPIPVRLLM